MTAVLRNNAFFRHVILMIGGSAGGQAVVALSAPLLSRLYSPADFGSLAVYAAVLLVLMTVASMRYERALPLPKSQDEATAVLGAAVVSLIAVSLLAAVGVWLIGDRLVVLTQTSALQHYLWLLPLSVLTGGAYHVANFWAIRRQSFGAIAQTKFSQGVGQAGAQTLLGVVGHGPMGLLIGQLIGAAAGTPKLFRLVYRDVAGRLPSLAQLWQAAVHYRAFPLFSSWSAIANTISVQVPVFLFAFYFGPATTGLYAFGLRVLEAPVSVVAQALSQVFLASASSARHEGRIEETTFQVFEQCARLAAPAAALAVFVAPALFGAVFGIGWVTAGVFAQWMVPWLFFMFICAPLSTLPAVMSRQRQEVLFQAGLLGGRIAAVGVGGIVGQPVLAAALFGIVSAVARLAFAIWILGVCGIGARRALAVLLREVMVSLLLAAPLWMARLFHQGPAVVWTGAAFAAVLMGLRYVRREPAAAGLRRILGTPVHAAVRGLHLVIGHLEILACRRRTDRPFPPVFMVGAPRSGTTLLYQVLVEAYDFGYLSNLHERVYGAPSWVERIVRPRGRRVASTFQSSYGRVRGSAAPSEAGEYWYRFFRRTPQHIRLDEMGPRRLTQLQRSVAAFVRACQSPVLFKNLINSVRLEPLAAAFPDALYLVVQRDDVANAVSLLRGRHEVCGSYESWFSLETPGFETLQALPPEVQVVEQINGTYRAIKDAEKSIGYDRILYVQYERFCSDVPGVMEEIETFLAEHGALPARRNIEVPRQFSASLPDPLDPGVDRCLYKRLTAYVATAND